MEMSKNMPALPQSLPTVLQQPILQDVVKQIAMDIGKAASHHIETMYPDAVKATSKNMLLSLRNTVYNEIMAALKTTDEAEILERLDRRKKHRRTINALRKAGADNAR